MTAAWGAISARHEQYRHDLERPLLAPEEIYTAIADLQSALATHARVYLERFGADGAAPGRPQDPH